MPSPNRIEAAAATKRRRLCPEMIAEGPLHHWQWIEQVRLVVALEAMVMRKEEMEEKEGGEQAMGWQDGDRCHAVSHCSFPYGLDSCCEPIAYYPYFPCFPCHPCGLSLYLDCLDCHRGDRGSCCYFGCGPDYLSSS